MAGVNSRFASVLESIFNGFLLKMLLRSLRVYILKQLFFSISVNSGRIFTLLNIVNSGLLQEPWRGFAEHSRESTRIPKLRAMLKYFVPLALISYSTTWRECPYHRKIQSIRKRGKWRSCKTIYRATFFPKTDKRLSK